MKEQPILFSGEMVRAILKGTKTQTRRVVKPQPTRLEWFEHQKGWLGSFGDDAGSRANPHRMVPCPYGEPGDRLIVKEAAWMWCGKLIHGLTRKTRKPKVSWVETRNNEPIYCADHPAKPEHVPVNGVTQVGGLSYEWHKKNARFLPRWASRITLEVVSVRVERLGEISESDAKAEGVKSEWSDDGGESPGRYLYFTAADSEGVGHAKPSEAYQVLWEKINGVGSWAVNPWVWVVEFKRAEA